MTEFKVPVSVLVVIYTPQLQVLLMERADAPGFWQSVTGSQDGDETLAQTAAREVLEETGVEAKFEGVVCFRHWHGYRWGKSDIYFVCRLSPVSEEITMQQEEIEECLWMPVEEYLASEYVSVFNKRIVKTAIDTPGFPTTWVEGYADPSRYEFFMPPMDPL